MSRYYGSVGYAICSENPANSGVWKNTIVERNYYGDIIKNSIRSNIASNSINNTLSSNDTISVIADAYALDNYMNIKYAEVNGVRWNVTSIDIQRPRLLLYLGSIYNGEIPQRGDENEQ